MKVHHLNCGTLYPYGCGEMVCHVLLVETDNGLVLIDSGFGTRDCGDPGRRVGPSRHLIRPVLNPTEAAVNQVERLGFHRDDVRHIVLTHFDGDHIGGISDFPDAQIHVTAAEAFGALRAPSRGEKFRFRSVQWAHGPKLVEHTPDGDKWRGFAAAKELDEVSPGIVMISLPGHTRGHACVAVDAGHRWLMHCGDSYFHYGTVDGTARMPLSLNAFERATAFEWKVVRQNHARLVELFDRREPDMLMVCAHDRKLYEHAKETA
ncbi:MAG TPA: MBL fold metallo-hydrolase [Mycobacterium sp.]|nr:MBL fold metallo-hydrolase [Mycobacterium sp.]